MHAERTVRMSKTKGVRGQQGQLDPIDMDKVGLQAGESICLHLFVAPHS